MTFDLLSSSQVMFYPSTRFMGSKNKLLEELWSVTSQFQFESVLDLFSGSGIVSYLFKCQNKSVTSNDYMAMCATFTKAMIENNEVILTQNDVIQLLELPQKNDRFVETTFKGLYFNDEDNQFIDTIRSNLKLMGNPYKKAIALSALIRACMKKRPRGIFTYIGDRYDHNRKSTQMTLKNHFLHAVDTINSAVFYNGKQNKSYNYDAMIFQETDFDLVYIDPPYYSPFSDNEYVRRYHFVEGLARNWKDIEIQENTKTKKFKSYPTPFSSCNGTREAFRTLFKRFRNSILLVSYSSNSQPTADELISLMKEYKNQVEKIEVDYQYSFGTQKTNKRNTVKEYIFIGY